MRSIVVSVVLGALTIGWMLTGLEPSKEAARTSSSSINFLDLPDDSPDVPPSITEQVEHAIRVHAKNPDGSDRYTYEELEEARRASPRPLRADVAAPLAPLTLYSRCARGCSGHDAGYNWAEEHDIADPYDCDGNSRSFIEGCEEFAEDRMRELAEQEQDG